MRPAELAKERFIAIGIFGFRNGVGDDGEGFVPGNAHKRLAPAQFGFGVPAEIFQIRFAHHGVFDSRIIIESAKHPLHQHFSRYGVNVFQRLYADHHTIQHDCIERPIMGGMGNKDGTFGGISLASEELDEPGALEALDELLEAEPPLLSEPEPQPNIMSPLAATAVATEDFKNTLLVTLFITDSPDL